MSVAANLWTNRQRGRMKESHHLFNHIYVPEGMLQNAIFSLIEGNITANVNRVHFITIFNLHFSGIISFAGFSIIHQRPTKRIGYFAQRSRLLFPPKEAATSAYDAVNK